MRSRKTSQESPDNFRLFVKAGEEIFFADATAQALHDLLRRRLE